jgi:hypothetical protein
VPKIEVIYLDSKRYHAAITNYSLSIGEKLGLLNGSNITDLLDVDVLENWATRKEYAASEHDYRKYLIVIYLSIIGINRNLDLTFDEFLEKYREDLLTLEETYKRLILASVESKPNAFAKGLNKSTKKAGKDQKQIKPPVLNIECAEDRYVLYCLVYGIDSEIFWYHPLSEVDRIFQSKQAYDGWQNNPK